MLPNNQQEAKAENRKRKFILMPVLDYMKLHQNRREVGRDGEERAGKI